MAAKYHVNYKGEPGVCHAKVRCPLGDLEKDHFGSPEEARAAYEKVQENGKPLVSLKKSGTELSKDKKPGKVKSEEEIAEDIRKDKLLKEAQDERDRIVGLAKKAAKDAERIADDLRRARNRVERIERQNSKGPKKKVFPKGSPEKIALNAERLRIKRAEDAERIRKNDEDRKNGTGHFAYSGNGKRSK